MAAFTNTAQLTYNGTTTNSNTVNGVLQGTLAVTKVPLSNRYVRGGDITYVVTLSNTSASAITGISLTDNLGAFLYNDSTYYPLTFRSTSLQTYVDSEQQGNPTVTSTQPLVLSNISLPGNSAIMFLYEASVNEYAPLGTAGSIENTVTADISGTPIDDDTTTVYPTQAAYLTIEKSIAPNTVSDGDLLTYTFTLENYGNTPTASDSDLSIRDVFTPALTLTSVQLGADAFTAYTYPDTSGAFVTTPGAIIVPAATFTRNTDGTITVNPGRVVLTVTGTV